MKASVSALSNSILIAVLSVHADERREFLGLAESRLVDFEKQKKKRVAKENALYLESFKTLLTRSEVQLTKHLKDLGDAA